MRAYVVRRLLLAIVTVFLVSIIVFLMVRLIPGNIVDAIIAQQMQIGETSDNREIEAARATIEAQLGLDRPILQQYLEWISRVARGDLGDSLWRRTPVIKDIAIRWPVTLELGILGLLIGQLIAIPIGIYSAQRQDTVSDYAARSFAIGLVALPGFWVGTLVIVFPSIWWGYQPPITYVKFFEDPLANLQMFLVAAAVLGTGMAGGTMRMMRTTMLEVLRQDYVRTAWSKGLKEGTVVARHALKNALIPIASIVGLQLPMLLGGTVIIEQIFNLPGMGRLLLESVVTRDYTVVSGVVLLFGIFMVMINLLVDLTYAVLDPRIHYR